MSVISAKRSLVFSVLMALISLASVSAKAKEIRTNEFTITDAPAWLTQTRVEKVTAHILNKLEWSIRRTNVYWYSTPEAFSKAHSLGPMATAVTLLRGDDITVHMGPLVDSSNFDQIFGHETVHVIVGQKYKTAIPKWLEEGLANHFAGRGKVDYKSLARQPFPEDVRGLAHPFNGNAALIGYRYMASQALAEMLDKKCNLENLIRLSVQRNMEDYIRNTCEITDLNKSFQEWVKKKAM